MLASLRYWPSRSLVARLDPRTKLIYLIAFLLMVTQFWDVRVLFAFLLIALGYYGLAGLPWRETRRAWLFILFFAVVLVGINTMFVAGGRRFEDPHVLFRLPLLGIPLHAEGLVFAAGQVCRILSIAIVALPIPFTTDPRHYGLAMRKMGLPDKFSFAVDLSLRFIPTIARDFTLTVEAQKARGYEVERLRGGPVAVIRRLAPLVVPLTIKTILDGEDVVNALELRAFGVRPRTWLLWPELRFSLLDKVVMGLALGSLAVATLLVNLTDFGDYWFPVQFFE